MGTAGRALSGSSRCSGCFTQVPCLRPGLGAAGTSVKVFFLGCVLVAGLYGAATASRKILFIQALPAALGLVLLMLS